MESKNQKLLESFNEYCKEHPELRFWQGLRAWADVNTIVCYNGEGKGEYWDTFYSNSQDGKPGA